MDSEDVGEKLPAFNASYQFILLRAPLHGASRALSARALCGIRRYLAAAEILEPSLICFSVAAGIAFCEIGVVTHCDGRGGRDRPSVSQARTFPFCRAAGDYCGFG